MVVDEYVGRCLDVGSTPTGSIKTRGVSLLFVYIGIYYEKTFVFDRFRSLTFYSSCLWKIFVQDRDEGIFG